MTNPDEEASLHVRPRPVEAVTLAIPADTLETLKRVAARRDMSVEALIKLYVGQGLRAEGGHSRV